MEMMKSLEKLTAGMGAEISADVAKDYYFGSGLEFECYELSFDFEDELQRNAYRKLLKKIERRKNLYIYFENSKYFGGCIGVIPASQAEDWKFWESRRLECAGKFEIMDHEMRINGVDDIDRYKKLNDFHAGNCKQFITDLERLHEKVICIA